MKSLRICIVFVIGITSFPVSSELSGAPFRKSPNSTRFAAQALSVPLPTAWYARSIAGYRLRKAVFQLCLGIAAAQGVAASNPAEDAIESKGAESVDRVRVHRFLDQEWKPFIRAVEERAHALPLGKKKLSEADKQYQGAAAQFLRGAQSLSASTYRLAQEMIRASNDFLDPRTANGRPIDVRILEAYRTWLERVLIPAGYFGSFAILSVNSSVPVDNDPGRYYFWAPFFEVQQNQDEKYRTVQVAGQTLRVLMIQRPGDSKDFSSGRMGLWTPDDSFPYIVINRDDLRNEWERLLRVREGGSYYGPAYAAEHPLVYSGFVRVNSWLMRQMGEGEGKYKSWEAFESASIQRLLFRARVSRLLQQPGARGGMKPEDFGLTVQWWKSFDVSPNGARVLEQYAALYLAELAFGDDPRGVLESVMKDALVGYDQVMNERRGLGYRELMAASVVARVLIGTSFYPSVHSRTPPPFGSLFEDMIRMESESIRGKALNALKEFFPSLVQQLGKSQVRDTGNLNKLPTTNSFLCRAA